MTILAQFLLAAGGAANVASGALLTLVVPLALLIVALVMWYVAFRRAGRG
jgi:hypothetical protein